jgi:methylated-DNA-[protein]-cysteine S-methyltransferase
MDVNKTHVNSPLGWIEIQADGRGITSLIFKDPVTDPDPPQGILEECAGQLNLYFNGSLTAFSLPLAPAGSPFQLRVWNELVKIPYGQVITYRDLANRLGGPTYTRIVGQANARNPVSILIPCHRVIGMNGALTGYAGGLWRKQFLLELEQKGGRSGFSPTLFGNSH